MKVVYTIPKLKHYDDLSKTWYVWFRYNGQLIKKTADINRIQDLDSRMKAGEFLASKMLQMLRKGWNPKMPDVAEGSNMTLHESLDFALEKKKPNLARKSYYDYSCTVRFIKKGIKRLRYEPLMMADVKMVHIKTILEELRNSEGWSNKAYNKHLRYLQSILSELIQWYIIPFNPAHKIRPMKVMKATANIPPTNEQLQVIKKQITSKLPEYWDLVLVIFHTGIRPGEITKIQIKHIDLATRSFILPPENTKTAQERVVPINQHLWEVIEPRLDHPKDFYLFGTFAPCNGFKMNFAHFIPGPNKVRSNFVSETWRVLVKVGLGYDVTLYSMKKAGANAKILAGMSVRALKEIFGHNSELTTEIYITNTKEMLRKEILEKSPAL